MATEISAIFQIGLVADRPAAGNAGAHYFATDLGSLARDNGSTWDELHDAIASASYPDVIYERRATATAGYAQVNFIATAAGAAQAANALLRAVQSSASLVAYVSAIAQDGYAGIFELGTEDAYITLRLGTADPTTGGGVQFQSVPALYVRDNGVTELWLKTGAAGTDWVRALTTDDAIIRTARLSLSSADLLALDTTPIEIVPAPGSGKIILPIEALFRYTHVTTAYTVGTSVLVVGIPGDEAGYIKLDNSALSSFVGNATSDTARQFHESAQNDSGSMGNQAITVRIESDTLADGDGTLVIDLLYRIADYA